LALFANNASLLILPTSLLTMFFVTMFLAIKKVVLPLSGPLSVYRLQMTPPLAPFFRNIASISCVFHATALVAYWHDHSVIVLAPIGTGITKVILCTAQSVVTTVP